MFHAMGTRKRWQSFVVSGKQPCKKTARKRMTTTKELGDVYFVKFIADKSREIYNDTFEAVDRKKIPIHRLNPKHNLVK